MAELKWDIPALHRHLQGVVAMLATDPALARHEKLADPVCWRASLPKTRHVMPALGHVPATPELIAKAAPSSLASPICGPGWLARRYRPVSCDANIQFYSHYCSVSWGFRPSGNRCGSP